MTQDENHLRLLSIFHYVVSALTGLFALFPIFHLVIGLLFIFSPEKIASKGEAQPLLVGWLFVIIAVAFITTGWTLAGLVFAAGRFLASRRYYTFCLVMGAIECVLIPFSGVFTIIVLMRESVQRLFKANTEPELIQKEKA
jgi:hypothetical protein